MSRPPMSCITLVAMSVSACSLVGGPGDVGTPLPLDRFRAEPHAFEFFTGLTQSRRVVIDNPEEWAAVWADIWRYSSPRPELPDVDFQQHMIVVAALGQRPTGGYDIVLEAAHEMPSGIIVTVRTVTAGATCGTMPVVTAPVDVARIPRSDRPVAFRNHADVRPCD